MIVSGTPEWHHVVLSWVLLYIGPDAFLPLTSALAAIAGVALMFWNRVTSLARRLWSLITRRSNTPAP